MDRMHGTLLRRAVSCLVVFLFAVAGLSTAMAASGGDRYEWTRWRYLPTWHEGRLKPLGTLAQESLTAISGRSTFRDPANGQRLGGSTWYMAMLFEWQGWERTVAPGRTDRVSVNDYFRRHEPDKWDRAALIAIEDADLIRALKLPADQRHVSAERIALAKARPPGSEVERPLLAWADSLRRRDGAGLTRFEGKVLELARRYWSYVELRMGSRLYLLPTDDRHGRWLSLAELLREEYDDSSEATGAARVARQRFRQSRIAYLAGDAEAFNTHSASFLAAINRLGEESGAYRSRRLVDVEVAYNRANPFRIAWILMAASLVFLVSASRFRPRVARLLGWSALAAGLVTMIAGFAARVVITGRAPVADMYESVLFVVVGVAAIGLVLGAVYRRTPVLTAAATVAAILLVLVDFCPAAVLDPSFRPLPPELRDGFWLTAHVLTTTLGFAAFALALGIGNFTLARCLRDPRDHSSLYGISNLTYRTLQVGVWLLVVGTIVGALWADRCWGRFWSWDPKEVWALITLLGYLAVLHAWRTGWVGPFGLSVLSIAGFSLVVMTWYGVNFVLGAGLHRYGFGQGGLGIVLTAAGLQAAYVTVASIIYVLAVSEGLAGGRT